VARDTIYLTGTHTRNALLYVVPPDTTADNACDLLKRVESTTIPMTVRMLRAIVGGHPASREQLG
jgi:hypothetical protein